jgi:choline dehydrogenase-like flavoprotein
VERFDYLIIGSGFGSLFFLHKLKMLEPNAKVAVIEYGQKLDHAWQISNKKNAGKPSKSFHDQHADQKPWNYTIGFGGGTNCWFGQAMRMVPADFKMRSLYGVMEDWPFAYDELEPFYQEAEEIMLISGDDSMRKMSPRSKPFPLPPHRVSSVDKLMIKAQPNFHFPIATARAPVTTEKRGRCCATATCNLCPMDAKFTAFNGFQHLMNDESVSFFYESEVISIKHQNGKATGVVASDKNGVKNDFYADVVVLGANGIQSPAILLRSGLDHPMTGVGICEQHGAEYEVLLNGLKNFDGGTITTSLNYRLYDGPHRADKGASLLFFENRLKFGLRPEYGRWQEYLPLIISVEDQPQQSNGVRITADGKAFVEHAGVSPYAHAGLDYAEKMLPEILSPLPVEKIVKRGIRATESHIQCSLRSGSSASSSVLNQNAIHHDVKNLIVVGSSTFTTCPPANPSLTVAATALRAAQLWVKNKGVA